MNKQEYVNSLRELADFVESKELPDNWKGSVYRDDRCSYDAPDLNLDVADKQEFGRMVAALGTFDKTSTDCNVRAVVQLEDGASITVSIPREHICKKVVVGKKIVPFREAMLIQAEPEHEEDVVEWECPKSLIALKGDTNDSPEQNLSM